MTIVYEKPGVIRLEWKTDASAGVILEMNGLIVGNVVTSAAAFQTWWCCLFGETPRGPYLYDYAAQDALLAAVIERIEG